MAIYRGETLLAEVNPDQVSEAEARAGTETETRLWSPDDVREAIAEFAPRERLAIEELLEGPGEGLSVTNSSGDSRTALFTTTSIFDLDDSDNQHGIVEVDVLLTLSGRSSTSIGFDTDINDPLLTARIQGFTTLSRVRAMPAYTGSQATRSNGIRIGVVDVRNGSGTLGTYEIWAGHDALNQMSVWLAYEGNSGSLSFSAGTDAELVVIHNDSAAAGGTARDFLLSERPAADSTLTLTGSSAGAWGESDLATTSAITAAQAGNVHVTGKMRVQVVTASGGGGDRYISELVLIRTRASVDTVIERAVVYGPRNLPTSAGDTSDAWSAASRMADVELDWYDEAQMGDTYKIQGRCLTQSETGTREVRFVAARSGILVTPA